MKTYKVHDLARTNSDLAIPAEVRAASPIKAATQYAGRRVIRNMTGRGAHLVVVDTLWPYRSYCYDIAEG